MTPEELRDLSTLREFPKAAQELVNIAGIEATAKLITAWPGQYFPVPLCGNRKNAQGERRFDQLAEIVGNAAAQTIVQFWGGARLTVPNCKEALWARSQQAIRASYDVLTGKGGYSHNDAVFELGITHQITGRCVELVLKRSPASS